jgi:hypothetical protein
LDVEQDEVDLVVGHHLAQRIGAAARVTPDREPGRRGDLIDEDARGGGLVLHNEDLRRRVVHQP